MTNGIHRLAGLLYCIALLAAGTACDSHRDDDPQPDYGRINGVTVVSGNDSYTDTLHVRLLRDDRQRIIEYRAEARNRKIRWGIRHEQEEITIYQSASARTACMLDPNGMLKSLNTYDWSVEKETVSFTHDHAGHLTLQTFYPGNDTASMAYTWNGGNVTGIVSTPGRNGMETGPTEITITYGTAPNLQRENILSWVLELLPATPEGMTAPSASVVYILDGFGLQTTHLPKQVVLRHDKTDTTITADMSYDFDKRGVMTKMTQTITNKEHIRRVEYHFH